MSPTKADYALAREAWCEWCGVAPGSPCLSDAGNTRSYPHGDRVRRAKVLRRGTIKSPLRPGERMPDATPPDALQLPLVGYTPTEETDDHGE